MVYFYDVLVLICNFVLVLRGFFNYLLQVFFIYFSELFTWSTRTTECATAVKERASSLGSASTSNQTKDPSLRRWLLASGALSEKICRGTGSRRVLSPQNTRSSCHSLLVCDSVMWEHKTVWTSIYPYVLGKQEIRGQRFCWRLVQDLGHNPCGRHVW